MSYILLFLLFGSITLSFTEISANFERIKERLESSGKQISIVGYSQPPEAASYLNHDLTQNVPHKVNLTKEITKSIREWTPRLLALDPTCPYYFSKLTDPLIPEQDRNLLSYLLAIESNKTLEYPFISILPDSYRNAVPLLSIFRCHHLVYPTSDSFFHNVELIIGPGKTELPFEQQSNMYSQLFCSLYGWPQIVLVDQSKQSTTTTTTTTFNKESFLSQEKFKDIDFISTNLAPGTCLYIPPEWVIGGELNNSISLSYTLKKIEKPASDEETLSCTKTGQTTIDNIDFDITDQFNITEIGLVVYFYQYLNPPLFDRQYTAQEFFQNFQSDRNISQLVMKWTPALIDLINNTLFQRLDLNKDNKFSVDDYFEIKRSNLINLQESVLDVLEKLRVIIVEQYQELNETISKFSQQVRDSASQGNTGEAIESLLNELPDTIKERLGEQNAEVKETIDKVNKKKTKRPSSTKQRVREDDASVLFDDKQDEEIMSNGDQEQEEEITAEPVDNDTELHRTDL